jgi:hypothetical protein
MGRMSHVYAIARQADEAAITRVLTRYCRAIDRVDAELLDSCFHDDATDLHGDVTRSKQEFCAWVASRSDRYAAAMHLLANILVEFDDDPDVAHVETYALAFHVGISRTDDSARQTLGLRYVDRFTRRASSSEREPEWRIQERVVVMEWAKVDELILADSTPRAKRDRTDASYWSTSVEH